jgi:cytidine deaminase
MHKMPLQTYSFSYQSFDEIGALNAPDAELLKLARSSTSRAYAPYSRFRVAAVGRMKNGEIIVGSNQENAAFPAGLCAERVLLSTASSLYPKIPVEAIAISYQQEDGHSDHPVAPCGICRQSLMEYESMTRSPIRLILGGAKGMIMVIPSASSLLPLAFTGNELL